MLMEFPRLDTINNYDNVFPLSSSNYRYLSDPSVNYGLWSGRTVVVREAVPSGVWYPMDHQFEPEMLPHGGYRFSPIRVAMPIPIPIHRLPPSPEIVEFARYQRNHDIKEEIILLGEPTVSNVSGTKRKAPPPPPDSIQFCSKKLKEEWRCAVCEVSVSCERGMNEHLAGKKHMAKVESLKQTSKIKCFVTFESLNSRNSGGDIGLGISKSSAEKRAPEIKSVSVDSKEVKTRKGGKLRKRFKLWCKTCKAGVTDEKVMSEHKKGKRHLKNTKKARKQKGRKSK